MKFSPVQRRWFFGAALSVLLACVAALLADALLAQWRPTLDLSRFGPKINLSERSRATLTDTSGTLSITAIFPTESAISLPTGRLLRAFAQTSRAQAGATLAIAYVDPRIDGSQVASLSAQGADGAGLLFRQAGRHVFLPERALLNEAGLFGPEEAESAIASAIARLSRQDGLTLGWLTGHGEPPFDDTDPATGFSGLRRALENEGCTLRTLTPEETTSAIPQELSAILIVNPRYPITVIERTQLADWLDRGGRVLYALPPSGEAGLGPLLDRWGIRAATQPRRPQRLAGAGSGLADALSAEHPVTRELAGRALLSFTAPRPLYPLATRGVSQTSLVSLVASPSALCPTNETVSVALAAERGATVGEDLAFRPGRLLVLSEPAVLENASVLNHASANRDFAVNAVRWLTGLSGSGARSASSQTLRLGWDRRARHRARIVLAFLLPLAFCWLLWLFTRKRA